jgi:hypothetical protein
MYSRIYYKKKLHTLVDNRMEVEKPDDEELPEVKRGRRLKTMALVLSESWAAESEEVKQKVEDALEDERAQRREDMQADEEARAAAKEAGKDVRAGKKLAPERLQK